MVPDRQLSKTNMKKLIAPFVACVLFAASAYASLTNITYTAQVEVDGKLGKVETLELRQDARDPSLADGLIWYFDQYASTNRGVGTNETLEGWLIVEIRDRLLPPHAAEKITADNAAPENAARLEKLKAVQAQLDAADKAAIDAILLKFGKAAPPPPPPDSQNRKS